MPQLIIILPAALLAITIALAWFARRGKRIDDHPLCRKCGFDLFAKPDESNLCPECGRDVTKPKSIRIGNRQPRRRLLAAILPVMVLSLVAVGIIGYGVAAGTNWNLYKPVWWLLNDAKGKDASTRDAAIAELLRRVDADNLNDDSLPNVIAAGLAHQADRSQPWLLAWGDVIERLRAKDRLKSEDWATYAKQALTGSLRVHARPYVRRGDFGFGTIEAPSPRLSAACFYVDELPFQPTEIGGIVNQNDVDEDASHRPPPRWRLTRPGYNSYFSVAEDDLIWSKVPDGPREYVFDQVVSIYESSRASKAIAQEHLRLSAPFSMHPATDPHFLLRQDSGLRAAMQKAVPVTSIASNLNYFQVRMQTAGGPVPLLMYVTLRQNGREVARGEDQLIIEPPSRAVLESHTSAIARSSFTGQLSASVDVVLVPMLDIAPWCPWIYGDMWGGEIVIHNVPLNSPLPN